MKIISGGQTGVDQAALRAAKACGLPTGGWAPKHWQTEDGPAPWLCGYGLLMHTGSYAQRTRANVGQAHATLIVTEGRLTGGTLLSYNLAFDAGEKGAGLYVADLSAAPVADCEAWLIDCVGCRGAFILNVAGPRESKRPGIGAKAEAFLLALFASFKESP